MAISKDVTFALDTCLRTHPRDYVSVDNYSFQSDNRNLTNLLVAGALDGVKSLTLQLPFDGWWDEHRRSEFEGGEAKEKYHKFYKEYPTYDDFVKKSPLFNDPASPILARARELKQDYGIDVRVSVGGQYRDVSLQENTLEQCIQALDALDLATFVVSPELERMAASLGAEVCTIPSLDLESKNSNKTFAKKIASRTQQGGVLRNVQ